MMMDKSMYPIVALFGGAVAGILRIGQQATGFEERTGLPIAGNGYAVGLLVVLTLVLVACIWLARGKTTQVTTLTQAFPADKTPLICMVAGCFLLIISGLLLAKEGFGVSQIQLLLGLMVAIGGYGLFGLITACRGGAEKPVDATFALASVFAAVLMLILCYRTVSINPVLWAYGIEVLALATVLMAVFQLIGFCYDVGQSHVFCISATLAIVLSCATLADGHSVGLSVYFMGNIVLLLGFLMAHCWLMEGKRVREGGEINEVDEVPEKNHAKHRHNPPA